MSECKATVPGPYFPVGPMDVFRERHSEDALEPGDDPRSPIFMFGMRDHGGATRDELVDLLNKGAHFDRMLMALKMVEGSLSNPEHTHEVVAGGGTHLMIKEIIRHAQLEDAAA